MPSSIEDLKNTVYSSVKRGKESNRSDFFLIAAFISIKKILQSQYCDKRDHYLSYQSLNEFIPEAAPALTVGGGGGGGAKYAGRLKGWGIL